MYRTFLACVVTAATTAAITSTISSGSGRSTSPVVKTIGVGQTAIFTRQDLICLNEPASGAPRFKTPGVACSSYENPYSGIGAWITRQRILMTRPPNVKVVASYRR